VKKIQRIVPFMMLASLFSTSYIANAENHGKKSEDVTNTTDVVAANTAAKKESPLQKYERCASAITDIVRQRNELRVMLKGVEKEFTGAATASIVADLQDQDAIVAKVRVLIDKIKAYNTLIDSITNVVPVEVPVAENGEKDVQKQIKDFVEKYNTAVKQKETVEQKIAENSKELKKLKSDLEKKAEQIKTYSTLIDSISHAIPGADGEKEDMQKQVEIFVENYNDAVKQKEAFKKKIISTNRELKKLKADLKKKIEEYDELDNYFIEIVNYAEENKD